MSSYVIFWNATGNTWTVQLIYFNLSMSNGKKLQICIQSIFLFFIKFESKIQAQIWIDRNITRPLMQNSNRMRLAVHLFLTRKDLVTRKKKIFFFLPLFWAFNCTLNKSWEFNIDSVACIAELGASLACTKKRNFAATKATNTTTLTWSKKSIPQTSESAAKKGNRFQKYEKKWQDCTISTIMWMS